MVTCISIIHRRRVFLGRRMNRNIGRYWKYYYFGPFFDTTAGANKTHEGIILISEVWWFIQEKLAPIMTSRFKMAALPATSEGEISSISLIKNVEGFSLLFSNTAEFKIWKNIKQLKRWRQEDNFFWLFYFICSYSFFLFWYILGENKLTFSGEESSCCFFSRVESFIF